MERLKVTNIVPMVRDATVHYEDLSADVVIADLPCSGIGTISKKPDIKSRLTYEDCRALSELQRTILDNVSSYVKQGGELIFSTCTVDYLENDDNVKYFLENHPEYKLIKKEQLLPTEEKQMDGFFVAIMKKDD